MRTLSLMLLLPLLYGTSPAQPGGAPPAQAFLVYPALNQMEGYAFGVWTDKVLITGGTIRGEATSPYPNLDLLLIDLKHGRTTAFPTASLPAAAAEQLCATGIAGRQEGPLLYLAGGFGYSDAGKSRITYPCLTVIDLPDLFTALEQGATPASAVRTFRHQALAVFDGALDFNGDEFFLSGGRYARQLHPFDDDRLYLEQPRAFQVTTFRLRGRWPDLRLDDLRVWHDYDSLERYYQALLPLRLQTMRDTLPWSTDPVDENHPR